MNWRFLTAILLTLAAAPACADDDDALSLADKAPNKSDHPSDLKAAIEGAWSTTAQRYGLPTVDDWRTSLDLQYDKTIAPGWRLLFSDRLDINTQQPLGQNDTINTLRELYGSWSLASNEIFDLGRINVRDGVATGYNPTDYFRADALRSITSVDPASLKQNRLGSVMLRAQELWDSGSLTELISPKLANQESTASFSPDLGATNGNDRWLLILSQRLSQNLNPQWLVYGEKGQAPQFGFNLTHVLNDATVAYCEWSGGHDEPLLSQAMGNSGDKPFMSRLATGLTYTTENKISLTMEYEYNGAGLDRKGWNTLRFGPPANLLRYGTLAQDLQDPPTRQSAFFYATWQDAMVNHLDLSAMIRVDEEDHSHTSWVESRYHWDQVDLALQWQVNSGNAETAYGALPQKRVVQVVAKYFFH